MLLDASVMAGVTPAQALAWDRWALERAAAGRGALRVVELAGDVVSLGRYHRAPAAARTGGRLLRRQSGGRVVAAGAGFVVVSLALPHRSALVAPDPLALAPEQVMNRCVRGVLEALALAGVSALYPGRDVVTAGGRPLALVSFEVDARGALLFEAVLAVARDASALPAMLERVDPAGVLPAAMLLPDAVTSVARQTGRVPNLDELASWLRRGYEAKFDVTFEDAPEGPPAVSAADEAAWLGARVPRADLDRHGRSTTMLGTLEVFLALDGGVIREACLAGDLLAPSATVARLEAGLGGCAAERGAVHAVVTAVLADPAAFVLGIGPPATLTDTIMRAIAP